MRLFNNVTTRTVCLTCGTTIEPSPESGYSRQTIVTYEGCPTEFPYCSNRCVNADSDRASAQAESETPVASPLLALERQISRAITAMHEAENAYEAALEEEFGREIGESMAILAHNLRDEDAEYEFTVERLTDVAHREHGVDIGSGYSQGVAHDIAWCHSCKLGAIYR